MNEKNNKGVLLFAINTEQRCYSSMANYCASKIKKHLDLAVTVVTNGEVDSTLYDKIIKVETTNSTSQQRSISGKTEHWNNFNRYQAYELSPYHETILLDTDYVCNSNQLLKLFELNQEFLCHRGRRYLGAQYETTVEQYGKNYDMWWATVIYFKRGPTAESVFDMMNMIQNNYAHYSKIYGFRPTPYRNDYALSIALNTVYGHVSHDEVEIPWHLVNVEFNTVVELIDNEWTINFEKYMNGQLKNYRITTQNQDLHLLNKDALQKIIHETTAY